jgi:predicted amidohydrolase
MVRVAALQLDCSRDIETIKDSIKKMIKEAAEQNVRIACLPEHWIPGDKPDLAKMLNFLKDLAKENKINIISGADFLWEDKKVTVQSVVISANGSILGKQDKVHLFGKEKLIAEAGNEYNVFDIEGIKIGIAICHDLVYPEVIRIYALKGAELIFSPAKIISEGLEPWHLYIKARALENRIPIISPNCYAPNMFKGGSLIVGLKNNKNIIYPEVLAEAKEGEHMLISDIDTKSMIKFREERLTSRRIDTYSLLTQK